MTPVEFRRHLHRHPELSFRETESARFIAEALREAGIPCRPIAGTGVLAKIEGRGDLRRAVVLRADIDALPIREQSGAAWSSENDGVMHACGHDIHAAVLYGTLLRLSAERNFEGTLFGIFQPGEESNPGGASKVLAENPFEGYTVLAVTTAGYVRTRVARVRTGLSRENAAALAALLNRNLTFVAPVDLSNRLLAELCSQIDPELVPVISAAAAILQDSAQPHVFLGGEQYLLNWPQLEGKVGDILTLLNDEEQAAHIIAPPADRSESVLLGEDLEPQIPGLCIVSDRYLVGGGLWGTVALIGPTRMPFQKLMPLLHLFADELGEGMSGKRKDTPQMAAPRRTVIYKEDLE